MEARLSRYEQHDKMTSAKAVESGDPFAPQSEPSRRKYPSVWDTLGEDGRGDSFYSRAAQPDRSPPMGVRREEVTLRRHSSLGAFSDDFVLPHLSGKESSGRQNMSPAMRRVSSASRRHGSSERLLGRSGTTSESDLSQIQEFQYQRLGQSAEERERLLRVSSPECDQGVYKRASQQGHKARYRHAQGQPNLSPEMAPRSKVARNNSYQPTVADSRVKVDSPLSVRRCPSDDKVLSDRERAAAECMDIATMEPPTKEESSRTYRVASLSGHVSKQSPGDNLNSEDRNSPFHQHNHSHSSSAGPESILMSNSTVGNTTNTETLSTCMSLELTSQSQRVEVSGSEFIERMDTQSGRESSEERVCLLSPVFSSLASTSEVTPVSNQTLWNVDMRANSSNSKNGGSPQGGALESKSRSYNKPMNDSNATHYLNKHEESYSQDRQRPHGQPMEEQQDDETVLISPITLYSQTGLDIFPPALSPPETNPTHGVRGDVSSTNYTSQVPLLGGEDEELTPREDDFSNEQLKQQQQRKCQLEVSRGVSAWVQDDLRRIATSQAAAMPLSPPDFTPLDDTSLEGGSFYSTAHRDYSMMSPIPEASQELTSSMSMSQTNTNINRLSGSHLRSQSRIRSVSPISEQADVTEVDDSSLALRQQSISPFQHSAISTSDHNSAQKVPAASSSSECGSTAQSSALTMLNTRPPQQQEMDSTTRMATAASSGEAVLSSVQLGVGAKRQERLAESRSRSATPVMASGGNSRESSVTVEARDRNLQVGRGNTSRYQTVEQLTTTNSGSLETSPTSGTMAQVAIDVSSAVRALTAQSTQESLLRGIHSRRQTVTNYSREPIQSSAESLGRSMRGSTPQSTSSAPARIQHSTDASQRPDVRRHVSPLSSTASRSATPQLQGGSVAAAHGTKRYSQQRISEQSTKNQQRINQDIEMMHLAISGMDVTPSTGRSQSDVPVSLGATRGPREQTMPAAMSGDTTRNRTPASRSAVANVESSRTFRPITPAMVDANSRPVSAPVITSSSRQSPSSPFETPPVSTASGHQQHRPPPPSTPSIATVSQSAAASGQASAPQPPHVSADSYDYLPPYSPPQNRGQTRQEQERVVQQQQLSSQQTGRQQNEPRLYPEPPPSYDEIFGAQNSSGRQRRRRGQRNQRGQETSSGTNDNGNRRSRSGLRRSTSQNEGQIRQSASHRRLASLTNIFRRVKRQSNSGNSQNQRAVGNQPAPPPTSDASRPMDTSEYVASWVESYSRTPRPVEAIEARSEAMMLANAENTGVYSQSRSHTLQSVGDASNGRSQLSASAHHGSSGGGNPIPYRPPPPLLTSDGDSVVNSYPPLTLSHSQALTDYSMAMNRASSDVGHPRTPRGGSQASRPNTTAHGHHHARPSTANTVRRVRTHEQQRRPASAVISSDANVTSLVRIQATHSGMDLATASQFNDSAHNSFAEQRQLSRRLGHTSNSCFDIAGPEITNEELQSEAQPNQREGVVSLRRGANDEAAAPATEEREQTNEAEEHQQPSQSTSLSQGHSQGDATSLAANVNANNTNTCASPRASNVSSPINMGSVVGSNSSLRPDSQPNAPSPISRAAVLSQTALDHVLPSSPPHCESRSSGTSLSSRAAARQRVEMRLSQQDVSSSDEESSQISSRSHTGVVRPPRSRLRRRRSQGSVSQAESFRSSSRLDTQLSQSRPADVQEETETNIESVVLSQEQSIHHQGDVRQNGTAVTDQEVQIGM